jgi:4-amino-4-deoxy-L-arabinose transferase-like glycosyltransferase
MITTLHGLKLLWLLTVLIAFFYHLQGAPLFDIDEGAFSQATREMAHRDDYLTLHLNGEPRHDKPILTYWLQAISVAVLGVNEAAFRLPSAIAATLWNLLVVLFTWRLTSPRTALIAGIFMAGTLGSGVIAKAATADALLNLFLTGTLFSLYFNLIMTQRRYLIATAVFAGLGFLTKGPIAIVIPAAVTLLHALWNGKLIQWLKILASPTLWLVFITVGLPWYLINYLRAGPGFIEGFIGIHNVGRFTYAMESHSGPWWYYLPAILLMAFPFSLILLQPLTNIKRLVASPLNRFLISWFLFVLLFFSLSATKLPHYILYGLTPLFILGALHLGDQVNLKLVFIPLVALILLLLVLPHLLSHFLVELGSDTLSETLKYPDYYLPGNYHLSLLLTLFYTLWLLFDRRWPCQGRLLSAGVISTFIISGIILPIAGKLQQEPIREAGYIAAQYPLPTVMWRINNPSFSVYSGRVTPKCKPTEGEIVLTKSRHLKRLPSHQLLYENQGVALALINKEVSHNVEQHPPSYNTSDPLGSSTRDAEHGASHCADGVQHPAISLAEP